MADRLRRNSMSVDEATDAGMKRDLLNGTKLDQRQAAIDRLHRQAAYHLAASRQV